MNYTIQSKILNPNKVFILHKSELERRFDPFYYIPELVELENKVLAKTSKRLRDYVISIASGATPKTTESDLYYTDKENGKPFLRVQNLSPTGILEFDDCKYINEETHNGMLKRSQVSAGDLLVKITGVGRMAVASVAPENFEGNINQHICVIKTKSKELSETLAAFLNSDIGEKLASRRSTGGTRPALDYPALLSIPIIKDKRILEVTQKFVEQKKQNEAAAEKLLSGIDDYLLGELGITLPKENEDIQPKAVLGAALDNENVLVKKGRLFLTAFSEIGGGRFDPKLYLNSTKSLVSCLSQSKFPQQSLKSIITQSVSGDWGTDDNKNYNTSEFVRCLVIRATEFDNKYNLNVNSDKAKFRLIAKQKFTSLDTQTNDLLIEKSGGSENQPVGRIAILSKDLTDEYVLGFSNFVHKIRINESVAHPEYVFNYLKTLHNIKVTDVMQSQTNGIRNLILNEYFSLPISLPPLKKQQEISNHITTIRKQAKQLKEEAIVTLDNAKAEVERIILDN